MKKLLLATALASVAACDAYAADVSQTFGVAEDHTRFAYAPAPVHEKGMSAHGNRFVTPQG